MSSSVHAYREPAPVIREPALVALDTGSYCLVRDHGPIDVCPQCDLANRGHRATDLERGSPEYQPVVGRFCTPRRRFRFGFLWLKKCPIQTTHFHQWCRRCDAEWITKPKNEA